MAILTVTRIAHATTLIDFDGHVILTDPWFSQKFTYDPGEPLGVPLASLPHLAGVLVSHSHYDHYDMQAFQAYPDKQVPFAVKRGIVQPAGSCSAGSRDDSAYPRTGRAVDRCLCPAGVAPSGS